MRTNLSRRGGFLRDLVLLLGIPGMFAIALALWWQPWRKLTDRRVMTLLSPEPYTDSAGIVHRTTEYDVLEHSRGRIRGAIRGETRRTEGGEPVVWDLVLVGPNTYRWHRTDWPIGAFTKAVRRCPPNAASGHDRVPP